MMGQYAQYIVPAYLIVVGGLIVMAGSVHFKKKRVHAQLIRWFKR